MRLLLLSISFSLSSLLSAQDNGFISGTFALNTQNIDDEGSTNDRTFTSGTFGPAVGYNLTPNHVVGLALTFTGSTYNYKINTSTNNPMDVTETANLTTIAPFYRYLQPVNEKFLLYGQAKLGFGFGKEITDTEGAPSDTETKISTMDARIGPGIIYVVADRWALSADWGVLGYTSRKETVETSSSDETTKVSGFQATLNPASITFALNWLF